MTSIDKLIASQKPGYALDQRFYTDPEIYDLEVERIINRNWILAGHQSELPEPGDFKVVNVANESAIIVRGQDDVIRAFANVCRHRGSLVCLEESGNTESYLRRLVEAFNPTAARGVMCRTTLSVDWRGYLYDCDFNQMLDQPAGGAQTHIRDLLDARLDGAAVAVGEHCFGCTAGRGSSCGGALSA